MKLFARWGLLLLIFAVALVFFGSVVCPPLDERVAEDAGETVQYPLQEDPGTYKPLPGDLQIEDRFPQRETDASTPSAHRYTKIEVLALDEQGLPIEGVQVWLGTTDLESRVARAEGSTDAQGRYLSPDMFPEEVIVELSHKHYFSAIGGPFEMPAKQPVRFESHMKPAGVLVGVVMGTDGKPQSFGWVHVENLETGEAMVLPIQMAGLFYSPPLASGNWRLRWKANPTAEQDPALVYSIPLEPKQARHFIVTVPVGRNGAAQIGAGVVGIEEIPD